MRDEVECRYHGRDFTTAEMALMRSLIAASPQQTRAGLAREFCHAINWVGPDDRIRVSGTSNPRSAFDSDLRSFDGDFTVEDFDNGRPG